MTRYVVAMLVVLPVAAAAQSVAPGDWTVTSRVVDATLPGVPNLLVRMMRGKSKAEHKRLSAGEGVEALLAPDPKAQCRIDDQRAARVAGRGR